MSTERTSRDSVELCLEAIGAHEDKINSLITVTADEARRQADLADKETADGRWLGLLHGVPMAIKDNIETAGVRTTSGSKFFSDHVPNQNAAVVDRLLNAGAIMVGKATMHELAFGIRSNNTVSPPCRNPWNTDRIPGG